MDTLLPPPLRMRVVSATDPGRVRARNEDAVSALPGLGLVVVADGMGGHAAGDRASTLAVEVVLAGLTGGGGGDAKFRVRGAIQLAHRRVLAAAERDRSLHGMGTTLTVLLADGARGRWVVGHVGDSRAYLLRGGVLSQVTRDQTWVQEQVDRGVMDSSAAEVHPMASMLLQAIGSGAEVDPQMVEGELQRDDVFLLCTDGLIRVVEDGMILEALEGLGRPSPGAMEAAARRLITLANARGGPDNVTLALARAEAMPGG